MKHELKRKPDVQKTTMLAIVVNAVQIGVLFAFVLYVLTAGAGGAQQLVAAIHGHRGAR